MAFNIPVYQPELTGNEKRYVDECLDSTWISSKGAFIEKFEKGFAKFTDIEHAVAVNNGTSAMHLTMLGLGIGPGDEVIVPTFTYIASVNVIAYVGATPIFVDSLKDSWQVDPESIRQKITPKTKAIMVVHLYGQACDMDPIVDIAAKNGLYLVEDCAEALGTLYKGKHVGQFGHAAGYSFFGNKTLTTGEGGMVTCHGAEFAERVIHYKGQGLEPGREYWHDVIGYNYRMTNIQAAIGLAQLETVEQRLAAKQKIAELYQKYLDPRLITFHKQVGDTKHSYWMCSLLVNKTKDREPLREHLKEQGIETRPLFYPIHTMPMYKTGETFPVAEDIAARGMNLPSWPGLTEEQVKFISDAVNSFLKETKK
jgi:perosamine synthetase